MMVEIGYSLSCEEHAPKDLVHYAQRAEEAGFSYAMISDHYHPWIEQQGQSPFVWSVLGAIAHATKLLRVGTGVTCPTIRYHPAIIAQAAATVAAMMPGRFSLGLGTGENLNEHIVGQRWPPHALRLAMLEEAIGIIRMLWQGGMQSFHGTHFTVENAQLYTLPSQLPPIIVAAAGPHAAELAGRLGDGLINYAADGKTVQDFAGAGGAVSRATRRSMSAGMPARPRPARSPTGSARMWRSKVSWGSNSPRRPISSRPSPWSARSKWRR
jgi:coenzyme F420-dependent glucose-6-phosphate dehydrogenase